MISDADYILVVNLYMDEFLKSPQIVPEFSPAFFRKVCPTWTEKERRDLLLAVSYHLEFSARDYAAVVHVKATIPEARKALRDADKFFAVLEQMLTYLTETYPIKPSCRPKVAL